MNLLGKPLVIPISPGRIRMPSKALCAQLYHGSHKLCVCQTVLHAHRPGDIGRQKLFRLSVPKTYQDARHSGYERPSDELNK